MCTCSDTDWMDLHLDDMSQELEWEEQMMRDLLDAKSPQALTSNEVKKSSADTLVSSSGKALSPESTPEPIPSPDAKLHSSLDAKLRSSLNATINLSLDAKLQPFLDAKVHPSPDLKLHPSPIAKLQPSSDSKLHPSPDVKLYPSLDAKTRSSLDAKTHSSLDAKTRSSLDAKTHSSLDAKTHSSLDAKTHSSLDAKTHSSLDAKTHSSLDAKLHPIAEEKNDADRKTVFVGNLEWQTTIQEIENHFKDCGAIIGVTIPTSKTTGKQGNYAFVKFFETSSAEMALQLEGSLLRNRRVRVRPSCFKANDSGSSEPVQKSTQRHGKLHYSDEPKGSYDAGNRKFQVSSTRRSYKPY